ncbi:hypothetical protein PR202_ga17932 [Eleusine coracana subsp. coracana]|uniref:Uncharacterized protein n=1 Tax=Eleusine coracana subsp. coracana TaxID=191504 RepID=A0AAV5CSB6_ELECO|nr:hypothetical protein PR202_ga17932 [Eleusine coracana subsp. coracana]
MPRVDCTADTSSGDSLLLLNFVDLRDMDLLAVIEANAQAVCFVVEFEPEEPDILKFVCNPVSGKMFPLPDVGGTKKVPTKHSHGLLTHSAHGHLTGTPLLRFNGDGGQTVAANGGARGQGREEKENDAVPHAERKRLRFVVTAPVCGHRRTRSLPRWLSAPAHHASFSVCVWLSSRLLAWPLGHIVSHCR